MPSAPDEQRDAAGRDPAAFVRANTAVERPPLVPEIALHAASEMIPIWEASEDALAEKGLPPPYWAFAWAGGQALARYVLDNPELVAGRRVLSFAAGSGLEAIAAAKAGAAEVEASEIDAFAAAAIRMNAALNGVTVRVLLDDVIGTAGDWDVVLAGDVFYERPMSERLEPWLRRLVRGGVLVLVGDPSRTYLPRESLDWLTAYAVKTSRELEDKDVRNTAVWRVKP